MTHGIEAGKLIELVVGGNVWLDVAIDLGQELIVVVWFVHGADRGGFLTAAQASI